MVQAAAARSKGVELEISAKPTEALKLIAGYTYGSAVYSESTPTGPLAGHKLPNWPTNAAHGWARYDILNGAMRGFGAGLGITYSGARIASTGTAAIPGEFILPSYTVVDFALYKEFIDGLYVTLKLNNALDRTYYQDGTITSGLVSVDAGAPRTAEIDLSWTFF
jgi:iron complex outermembrane receptor protein